MKTIAEQHSFKSTKPNSNYTLINKNFLYESAKSKNRYKSKYQSHYLRESYTKYIIPQLPYTQDSVLFTTYLVATSTGLRWPMKVCHSCAIWRLRMKWELVPSLAMPPPFLSFGRVFYVAINVLWWLLKTQGNQHIFMLLGAYLKSTNAIPTSETFSLHNANIFLDSWTIHSCISF